MTQTNKAFALLGAGLGEGAKIPGTKKTPRYFRDRHVLDSLNIPWTFFLESPDDDGSISRRDIVYNFNRQLCAAVGQVLTSGQKPILIGGDHAIAIGMWSAFPKDQPLGLIWIDAHLDSHTPDTSPSGAIHGMPVAALMGHGDRDMIRIGHDGPKVKAEHIVFIGARSYEREEHDFLKQHGVKIVYMDDVTRLGFSGALKAAFDHLKDCPHIGISIDLDAFDPVEVPGVGSPEPGGIQTAEALPILKGLAHHPKVVGLEITELNPELDRDGLSCRFACDLIHHLLDPESSHAAP